MTREQIAAMFKLTERRAWLAKHAAICGVCRKHGQVQLVEWTTKPALWSCRRCLRVWTHEPKPELETKS